MINRFTDETIYNQECVHYEGFQMLVGDPPKLEILTFEKYKKSNHQINEAFAKNIGVCFQNPKE